MSDKRESQTEPDEATERTPKGYEVPIPKRRDFFANLKKVAKVAKRSTPSGSGADEK